MSSPALTFRLSVGDRLKTYYDPLNMQNVKQRMRQGGAVTMCGCLLMWVCLWGCCFVGELSCENGNVFLCGCGRVSACWWVCLDLWVGVSACWWACVGCRLAGGLVAWVGLLVGVR